MAGDNDYRPLRGTLGNAAVWGLGFFLLGLAAFAIMRLVGTLSPSVSVLDAVGMSIKFGVMGVIAGAVFATIIRLVYRGRRLSDINWVRFGVFGGIATGIFVPCFLQLMNVLTGGEGVPWHLLSDDAVWSTLFGAVVAGGSLRLAQHAEALAPARDTDRLNEPDGMAQLPSAGERKAR